MTASQLHARNVGAITGYVREKSSAMPMEYVTVSLHSSTDSTTATACITDSIGRFLFTGIQSGNYYVECDYIGYTPIISPDFIVSKEKTIDLGTLYMTDNILLSEVVVEGHKSTFVAGLDKKIFNAGEDLASSGGSASELLQNIPSVDVDMDGVVKLRGNENVTILINGKPSVMTNARNRGDALNQIPANSIDRIEIITNPTAEYKPDGISGIINIVLKKGTRDGFNGTLNANIGSYNRLNSSVSLNYRTDFINFYGGYAYRRDRYDRTITDHRESPFENISQNTYGLGRPISHTINLGTNINVSSHDILEVAGAYNRRKFRRNESMESETLYNNGIKESYSRIRDALAYENMWEASARYSHSYGTDNEWGIEYSYSSESEDEINHYTTTRSGTEAMNDEAVWDANYLNSVKLFWKHNPTDNMRLSMGYEMEYLKAEQSFHVSDWNGADYVPDIDRCSDFAHFLWLNSAFVTAELRWHEWDILAGLRGEYADIKNKLLSEGRNLSQNYRNFFPTIHVSRPIMSSSELMLSYSLRVNRPDARDMNPFAEQINPLNLEAGNPYLKPEKIHSAEVGWMFRIPCGGTLLSTIYYRFISNKITEVSKYVDSGILLTTKENMQSSQNAGIEMILNMPVVHWFDFNLNFNGYYDQIDATKLGLGKNRDIFSWSMLFNADFRPMRRYMTQINVRYRSSTLVPQGKRDGDFRVNVGMRYDIPGIGLSLSASVTDLFDTYRKSYTLDTPELKQKVEKRRNPRIFYFGVTWRFGGKNKKEASKIEYDENL